VVTTANGAHVDFADVDGEIGAAHTASLVSGPELGAVFGRVRGRGLADWADPARTRPDEVNRPGGGRVVPTH
jgi:hypothetical protein